MEEQLKQYLKEFVETLKQGGEFAMEQLPLFVHEYLTYYTAYHGILMVFGLIIITVGIYGYCKFWQFESDEEFRAFMILPTSLVLLPGLFLFFHNLFEFVKITLAPRMYLIENLLELL